MDGVHVLRKRNNTRLWYRQIPVKPQRIINPKDSADVPGDDHSNDEAWEQRFTDLSDEAAAEASDVEMSPRVENIKIPTLPAAPVVVEIRTPAPVGETRPVQLRIVEQVGEDWRTVPASAPSIMLSATELLDARNPGPILHPGVRYRIAEVQNGIVRLYVIDPTGEDGDSGFGYCSTVDLICVDRRFASYHPGRAFDATTPFRSRVTRLTGTLSQATTSLFSAATNGSRPS
jgi:hypothetical protein